jgi:general secretion pathway protein C
MATAANNRVRTAIVLVTLALCALFMAQGATALLAYRTLDDGAEADVRPRKRRTVPKRTSTRHDPNVVLRRNIFDSSLGDLTVVEVDETALPQSELPDGEVEALCNNNLRLIGTVVVPGRLEQSLAAIVGTDSKANLHRGGSDVDGSRIRAIQSDSVVLQTTSGFCRLAMFEVEPQGAKPIKKPVAPKPIGKRRKASDGGPDADRNAGLSDSEIAEGIEKINDTNYNISRTMMNKVLDNAGRLIGIAAVRPKMENGESIGMEIRGVRSGTLLTKLGIQNGDILESVNGQSLTSTDAALGAYTTLRTSDKFNLSIRRDGKSMIINYNLQ